MLATKNRSWLIGGGFVLSLLAIWGIFLFRKSAEPRDFVADSNTIFRCWDEQDAACLADYINPIEYERSQVTKRHYVKFMNEQYFPALRTLTKAAPQPDAVLPNFASKAARYVGANGYVFDLDVASRKGLKGAELQRELWLRLAEYAFMRHATNEINKIKKRERVKLMMSKERATYERYGFKGFLDMQTQEFISWDKYFSGT
jgi:hypothetical protein